MYADFAFYSFSNKYFKILTTKKNQSPRKTFVVSPAVWGYGPQQDIKVLRNMRADEGQMN